MVSVLLGWTVVHAIQTDGKVGMTEKAFEQMMSGLKQAKEEYGERFFQIADQSIMQLEMQSNC